MVILTLLFCFLLLFPVQTLEASKTGLLLWFDTLLPTLLPFLILSQLILKTPLIDFFQKLFSPIFRHFFHCSADGAFCILCGFLCGYPVGARLVSLQIKEQKITLEEGQYLLSFCNNVSPSFCISYGILYAIGETFVLPYLLIIYGSALLFGFLTRPKSSDLFSEFTKKQTSTTENIFQLIDVCIIDSFLILIKLCGYLMLFSILCTVISLLPFIQHPLLAPLISSFLEITTGLSLISNLPIGTMRSALAVTALTFGGLCCIFQTNSVICDTKISLKKYIVHKGITALFALCLFLLWSFFR